MAEVIRFRGTSEQAREIARSVPGVLSGRLPDRYGIARGILLRASVTLLSQVYQSFLKLSVDNYDPVTGITWPPLSPKTIAARRTTVAERRVLGIRQGRTRPSLTDSQDKKWRGIFVSRLAQLRARGMGDAEAKGMAAAAAWSILKAGGAKTKLELLGNRKVAAGRDTGALLRSLNPGVTEDPTGPPDQIIRVEPGRVTVGSNRPYAGAFHNRRPMWRRDGSLPREWRVALSASMSRGVMRAIVLLLSGRS